MPRWRLTFDNLRICNRDVRVCWIGWPYVLSLVELARSANSTGARNCPWRDSRSIRAIAGKFCLRTRKAGSE